MRRTSKRPLLAPLAGLLLAACATVPPRSAGPLRAAGAPLDVGAAPARPERMLVTGSRIPRRVDPRSGVPETFSPVSIHTREELLRTGVPGDFGVALRRLDASVGP